MFFVVANNAAFVFQESCSNAAIGRPTGSAVLANWSAANTVPKRSRNKYNYRQFEDRSIMFHCPCYIISCTQIEVGPTPMSRPYMPYICLPPTHSAMHEVAPDR